MAEMHIIGQIVGASKFSVKNLFCVYKMNTGPHWTHIEGVTEGQTQNDTPGEDGIIIWAHPIDIHYSTSTCAGWPKIYVKVYYRDFYDRNDFAGYGVITIPTQSGTFDIECPIWRPVPTSLYERVQEYIMGCNTQVKEDSMIFAGEDRRKLKTIHVGIVHFHLSILLRNFSKFDVQTKS